MVLLRYRIFRIVRTKRYRYPVIRITPDGVVIRFTYKRCGALHEKHGLFESGEFEGFMEGIVSCFPSVHGDGIN